jgi:coiled-coil domain-containing protein 41
LDLSSGVQVEAERQNEALLQKWKIELEQKKKEFDEWQANLIPQDLDMLRIKIQEELQGPHTQKVQALQTEIEALRQQMHQIRTEKLWLQTELERTVQERKRDSEEMKSSYDQARADFRRKLVEYEQQVRNREGENRG